MIITNLDFEIEEDFENKTIDDYQDCIIVFDDMLDSKPKINRSIFYKMVGIKIVMYII